MDLEHRKESWVVSVLGLLYEIVMTAMLFVLVAFMPASLGFLGGAAVLSEAGANMTVAIAGGGVAAVIGAVWCWHCAKKP